MIFAIIESVIVVGNFRSIGGRFPRVETEKEVTVSPIGFSVDVGVYGVLIFVKFPTDSGHDVFYGNVVTTSTVTRHSDVETSVGMTLIFGIIFAIKKLPYGKISHSIYYEIVVISPLGEAKGYLLLGIEFLYNVAKWPLGYKFGYTL